MTKKYQREVRLHRIVAIHRPRKNEKNVPGRAIERIKVQESNGNLKVWKTTEAIKAMVGGTDAFFVIGVVPWPDENPTSIRTVWSPVTPWPYKNPKTIRTVTDKKRPDNLMNLPTF